MAKDDTKKTTLALKEKHLLVARVGTKNNASALGGKSWKYCPSVFIL